IWQNRSHPLQEDMGFQRRAWRMERVAWSVMGLLVLLTGLGLFSDGVLSTATAHDESRRIEVDYDRFYRNSAAATMRWRIQAAHESQSTVSVNQEFAEAFMVEAMLPEPSSVIATHDGVRLVFDHDEGASMSVVLHI